MGFFCLFSPHKLSCNCEALIKHLDKKSQALIPPNELKFKTTCTGDRLKHLDNVTALTFAVWTQGFSKHKLSAYILYKTAWQLVKW